MRELLILSVVLTAVAVAIYISFAERRGSHLGRCRFIGCPRSGPLCAERRPVTVPLPIRRFPIWPRAASE